MRRTASPASEHKDRREDFDFVINGTYAVFNPFHDRVLQCQPRNNRSSTQVSRADSKVILLQQFKPLSGGGSAKDCWAKPAKKLLVKKLDECRHFCFLSDELRDLLALVRSTFSLSVGESTTTPLPHHDISNFTL
jgi:hypothetical protein